MACNIPEEKTDLTKEWLATALGVDTSYFTEFNTSAGTEAFHLGQVVRIDVSYANNDKNLPKSFALKLHPGNEQLRGMAAFIQALTTEQLFYQAKDLVNSITSNTDAPIHVPICYQSNVNEKGDKGFLLLEWLDATKWTMLNLDVGCNSKQKTFKLIKSLAAIHATNWCNDLTTKYNWLQPTNDAISKSFFASNLAVSVKACLESKLANEISDPLKSLIAELTDDIMVKFMDKCMQGETQVLIHNDFKMENLMFQCNCEENDDQAIAVYDWQVVRYSGILGALLEFFLFISRNVAVELIREDGFLDSIVEFYLTSLKTMLAKQDGEAKAKLVPSKQEADKQLQECCLYALSTIAMLCTKWAPLSSDVSDEKLLLKEKRHRAVFERSIIICEHFKASELKLEEL